jgi:hypothetical protein
VARQPARKTSQLSQQRRPPGFQIIGLRFEGRYIIGDLDPGVLTANPEVGERHQRTCIVQRPGLQRHQLRRTRRLVKEPRPAGWAKMAGRRGPAVGRARVRCRISAHRQPGRGNRNGNRECRRGLFLTFAAMADITRQRPWRDHITHRATLAAAGDFVVCQRLPPDGLENALWARPPRAGTQRHTGLSQKTAHPVPAAPRRRRSKHACDGRDQCVHPVPIAHSNSPHVATGLGPRLRGDSD